ncbi:DUF2269 family protein [Pseudoduganella ginsengisoli]|uniref:DUF2269 family protein n=1 Tax=Pseudoduganella ginsengisoli TaxID=1462440 RepID=A0A6L6PVV3_9BURK|nr:DUF2269 domain-containing protein [Pseudoduganella ginsengisoli]MTW01575.1 DUF2269 family protein [Pseudoduganella ginsengisoli]
MDYVTVKWLHIVSSALLFGTGIGSAWYLLFATLSRDVRAIAVVARNVVRADWLFSATTMVLQPLTGWWMAHLAGFPLHSKWLTWSIGLYGVAGLCWLPVVWLQMKLRDAAALAAQRGTDLPPEYWRWFRWWVVLGIPACFAFVAVFYLMVAKPM